MALVYLFLRAIAFALMKKADWKQRRAKSKLEKADKMFREIENACKAEEVRVGRPANFASQFKLMKLFEMRDAADDRWKSAAVRSKRRTRFSNWLAKASGKKLPYAFGVVDMVLGLQIFKIAEASDLDWNQLTSLMDYFA